MHWTGITPEPPIGAVDSHAHLFRRDLPMLAGRRHTPEVDALLSDYLALLDAHHLTHGLLVQPSFLGEDNSFMLAALQACPQRLRGVAVLAPTVNEVELAALAAAGICGIRLNLLGLALPELADADWQRWFGLLRELGWHVELHIESSRLEAAATPLLTSGCNLVIDHFGRPGPGDTGFGWLLKASKNHRLWVKLAAAYRSWPEQNGPDACAAAQALLQAFSAERLLWGSDWPHTQHRSDYGSTLAALSDWVPDAAQRKKILVDTPAQLFGFAGST